MHMVIRRHLGLVRPLDNEKLIKLIQEELQTIHELWANNKLTNKQTTENTIRLVRMLRPLDKQTLTLVWNKCVNVEKPLLT